MFYEYLAYLLEALLKLIVWRLTRTDLERENLNLLRENQILKRRQKNIALTNLDRQFYVVVSRYSRDLLSKIQIIQPETVLRWHRKLVAWKWEMKSRRVGCPPVTDEIRRLVIEMKIANPRWGSLRIAGELHKLGLKTCKATVASILKKSGHDPGRSSKAGLSWKGFVKSQGQRIFACDFFTVDTLFWKLFMYFL